MASIMRLVTFLKVASPKESAARGRRRGACRREGAGGPAAQGPRPPLRGEALLRELREMTREAPVAQASETGHGAGVAVDATKR